SYTIGPDGRVHSCVVTVSSGHPALDRPTCALVERRLFYRQPATDANGNPVSAVRTQRVHWVLPDDDPPPPVYPPRR
ncbi:MAG TPA: energy transducer TonB, partial [Allosphingosinicella sp.]